MTSEKGSNLLFLCVANSARSQMAEAIARALAPQGVSVQSAGSRPTTVRPEAIQALNEAGFSADGQRSKSVQDIDPATVDTVITLCQEEVCPVFLGGATRLHWGLFDPASVEDPSARLDAFRKVRDELFTKLKEYFSG